MRHLHLTCKNHPTLNWSCKEIAYSPGFGYNGQRHIFFDGPGIECSCSPKDLVLHPNDPYAVLSIEEQRKAINAC